MRKLISTICMTLLVFATTFAQSSKVMTASSYLDDYNTVDKKVEYLMKAKEAIDAAGKHEVTSLQGKTWFLTGQILHAMANDENIQKSAEDNFFGKAMEAYEKALTIVDKKFRDQTKVVRFMTGLSADIYNDAVDSYQAGDYTRSYNMFYMMKSINATLAENGGQGAMETGTCLSNAAMAADAAGMKEEAMAIYKELIVEDPKPIYYMEISKSLKAAGDREGAMELLTEGTKKFTDNSEILIELINYYLQDSKLIEALDLIDKAIELQPENDMLHFVKGDAYEKSGKLEEAQAEYEIAVEKNPDNVQAIYNIGVMYFNKANVIVKEMNELGINDNVKYDELNAQRKDLYRKAKPFFEQVLEKDPEDVGSTKALNKINATL